MPNVFLDFFQAQSHTCPFIRLPFRASEFCWGMCLLLSLRNPFKMNKTWAWAIQPSQLVLTSLEDVFCFLPPLTRRWLCSHADFHSCEVEDNGPSVGPIEYRVSWSAVPCYPGLHVCPCIVRTAHEERITTAPQNSSRADGPALGCIPRWSVKPCSYIWPRETRRLGGLHLVTQLQLCFLQSTNIWTVSLFRQKKSIGILSLERRHCPNSGWAPNAQKVLFEPHL